MSGWKGLDAHMAEDYGDDFPAVNNITIRGQLPSDQVPAPLRSNSVTQAHFKSLRCFRKWCRCMPFIVHWNGMRRFATPEVAKLNLARHWRHGNKVRSADAIDLFTKYGYERLYNIQ